jgi:zinc transporter
MADVIGDIDDAVDQLEAEVLTTESHQLRASLASVRRQVIALRRYLAPQREAMTRLQHEKVPWLDDGDRVRLREIADRITRYMEDLDAARDRAAVTHEELASRLSEQMNRRMYLLSMVAAVFLPLGFLTGLLGINVAGIPGEKYPWAFEIVVLMLIGVIGLQIWIFKRWKWL